MLRIICMILLTNSLILSAFAGLETAGHERHVHVNGEHLNATDIAMFDQIFTQTVPDGYYLVNFQTGEWGYEGSTEVKGILQGQQQAQQQPERSLMNRTQIYNSQNGSAVSGSLNGKNCTFVSAGGMTFKSCD